MKQSWYLTGVVSLPPAVGSVLATLVLPEHLRLGEKEQWHDPSPNWCVHEMLGQIHTLENRIGQAAMWEQASRGEGLPELM